MPIEIRIECNECEERMLRGDNCYCGECYANVEAELRNMRDEAAERENCFNTCSTVAALSKQCVELDGRAEDNAELVRECDKTIAELKAAVEPTTTAVDDVAKPPYTEADIVQALVDTIELDLNDRRGFHISSLDEDCQNLIRDAWSRKIRKVFEEHQIPLGEPVDAEELAEELCKVSFKTVTWPVSPPFLDIDMRGIVAALAAHIAKNFVRKPKAEEKEDG